ncbi:hypothetical protein CK203_018611 [Vitis vinifera]|uniref:DUF4283 domain-containing protein n=1 Tax=Vitis vinifera TaxID=29760 RepID=A0A438J5Z8_VITVI|nr:hypothetical protein CK203_018611 [Vitis vinifera]
MVLRGGSSRFVVESKWFEIVIEELGGRLKGCIWERSRGFESWIRFGEASLRCLLEGVETCCREVDDQRWAIEWVEGNRKFRMERRLNKAGRFILCSVRDMEAKRYSIIFPEGKGQASGWNSLAVRLRGLGVTPTEGLKISNVPEFPVKPKGVLKVQWKEKGVEMKSFAEAVNSSPRRAGESVWLEVGENEELDPSVWEVKGKLSIAALGRGIMLFEFDQAQEAERVLARGKRSLKDNWLILDKWNPEVGCSLKNPNAVETWVRVVGLPLHFWCFEVFKSIGDGCGGFIAVDEGTKSMSELQWARILVKRVDWEVVPAGSSSGKGGLRAGEEVDVPLRVACCGSQRKGMEQLGSSWGCRWRYETWRVMEKKLSFPLLKPLQMGLLRGDGLVASRPSGKGMDLGRGPRPNPCSFSEGMSGEAGGPIQAGALLDEVSDGFETPYSLPRAQFMQSIPISRGVSQDARGEVDPLVGLPRDSSARVSSQMMDRGFLTDEALAKRLPGMDGCRWDDSYLARFSKFLGFSTDGFEGEVLNLLLRTKRRREQNLKKGTSGTTKFDRELKKLEWSINYTGARKEKSVVREGGETKIQEMSQGVIHSLGVGRFLGWGAVDARGAAGGVVVFWDKRVLELVGLEVGLENFWEELGAIRGLWTDPWCIGGSLYVEWGLNGQSWSRLDRFLISEDWENHFSGVSQCTLPRPVSDHYPILLDGGGVRRGPIPFRFENMWLKEEGFKELLRGWWQGFNYSVGVNLRMALGRVSFWDDQERQRTLNEQELEARKEAKEEFKKWAIMEEISWRQKSRQIWLKEGDKNTGFFHKMANSNSRRNCLKKIKVRGVWLSDEQDIQRGVVRAYQDLLSDPGGWHPSMSSLEFDSIGREERCQAGGNVLFGRGVSGPFGAKWGQGSWTGWISHCLLAVLLGFRQRRIMGLFKDFFERGKFVRSLNSTFLVLVPKKGGAEDLRDYRPISLVGGLYKILAKVLANRLKKVVGKVVSSPKMPLLKEGKSLTQR